MPNPAKGPRLWLRNDRGRKVWVIRDGDIQRRTGCSVDDRERAEQALEAYIAGKWRRPSGPTARQLTVSEVLAIYGADRGRHVASPETIGFAIKALVAFWGDAPVASVKGETCRRYAAQRGLADGTVRRELGTLNAALRHCWREGYLTDPPAVTLPPKSRPRERWLTRSEMARLLRAARRWPHLARFILIGLYTGSRAGVIRSLQWAPNDAGGHVDLEHGVLYRQSAKARATKKRAPAARIPRKLMNHLRRWERMADTRRWIVEWNGGPIGSVKRTWRSARTLAGLGPEVIPYTLRHTAITWMLQLGARPADVSALAGVTFAGIERTYLHHSPDHQKSALDALGG